MNFIGKNMNVNSCCNLEILLRAFSVNIIGNLFMCYTPKV